jgi:hypothetical protein
MGPGWGPQGGGERRGNRPPLHGHLQEACQKGSPGHPRSARLTVVGTMMGQAVPAPIE